MLYKSFSPGPPLKEFVRNYTIIDFQSNQNSPVLTKQRAPKAEQKIVFYLRGTPSIHDTRSGHSQQPPPVSIFSHQTEQRTIRLGSGFMAFIIFLQPGILHRVMQVPMTGILHQTLDAELFFGTGVREVSERLSAAKDHFSMISIAEQFLLSKFDTRGDPDLITAIANHIVVDPAALSLDQLAQQACLSTKQFYRRFTTQIGISPKLFTRLSRFNLAYQYKISQANISWSTIAQVFRYTDYHHMEKEFKQFTGYTPQGWTDTHLRAPERILKLR